MSNAPFIHGNSGEQIEQWTYTGDIDCRLKRTEPQNERNSPAKLRKVQSEISLNKIIHPNGSTQGTSSQNLGIVCEVCGDQAAKHTYCGGVSCLSCRAFFRRSVSKSHTYICHEGKRCSILITTRTHCRHCRYRKCLRAGMTPTLL